MTKQILLWIDDSSYLQYCIASLVQEQINCNVYAIADVNEKGKQYLQNQTFTKFKKIWFLRDHISLSNSIPDMQYLEKFEENYKINLWVLAYSERLFYRYNVYHKFSRDEILTILEKECRIFEEILGKVSPDYVFIKFSDFHQNHLFLELAKSLKIKVLTLAPTKLGNSCHVSQEQEKIDQTKNMESFSENELNNKLKNYLKLHDPYIKDKQKAFSEKTTNKKRIFLFIKFLSKTNTLEYKNYYANFGRSILKILLIQTPLIFKNYFRTKFLDKNALKKFTENKIIFFPLHLEPDRATLINSPFYSDQLDVILNVAKSLPIGYTLLVKEHGSQSLLLWRKTSFYKKILSIPNVKLIHPFVDPKNILKKSSLVITIAGTVGLEALFYNKPVLVFADTTYSSIPGVFRLDEISKLPSLIRTALSSKINDSGAKEIIQLIEQETIPIDLTELHGSMMQILGAKGVNDLVIPTNLKFEKFLKKHIVQINFLVSKHIEKMKLYDDDKIIIGKKKDLMHFD
jgi:hypothetical protein